MRRSRIGCGKTGSEGRMSGKKNSELGVAIGGLGAIGLGVARRLDEGIPGLRLAAVSARDRGAAAARMADFRTQHGRASCRERGCWYVWNPVVAGLYNKNNSLS